MQNLRVAGIQFDINWKNKEKNFEYLHVELKSVIERAIIISDNDKIEAEDLIFSDMAI